MRNTLMLMLASSLLAGCGSFSKRYAVETPANLAAPCDPMKDFVGKTIGDLVKYTTQEADDYHRCQAKQQSLADFSEKTR